MLLSNVEINTRTRMALNKKKIFTVTEFLRTFPRKYLDYTKITPLKEAVGKECVIAGHVESVAKTQVNGITKIDVDLLDLENGVKVKITWFGAAHLYKSILELAQQDAYFCGKVKFDQKWGYQMSMDATNSRYGKLEYFKGRIIPVYTKIADLSEDMRKKLLNRFLMDVKDPLDDIVLQKTKLMKYADALRIIHYPTSMEELKEAQKRIVFNDMLYFTIRLKTNRKHLDPKSPYVVRETENTEKFIDGLPYTLTEDQRSVIDAFILHTNEQTQKRFNALVQGDVGCGKSVVAFGCMFLMAENHYQSVIMAPTTVLADQHYEELKGYADKYGYNIAKLTSDIKGKKKTEILTGIKNGDIDFIVGTQSVISDHVVYANLGLVVTDEEHRFGVKQREKLEEKAGTGAHVISMSATPIPRTIADVLYGIDKVIYTIKTRPSGRKATQTAINNSDRVIYDFIEKQLKEGRQAYVVCPLISEDMDKEERKLYSVEEAYKQYEARFKPLGYQIAVVTGKMKKEEVEASIELFKRNEAQILISTTVIEVGVNVPNASVIVINNAEMFGLAQLHQLRGRVGRGSYSSYCILKSKEKENKRLLTMVSTTDGFEIANEDLKQRGVGDLIGTEQSGNNAYVDLVLGLPNLYEVVKKYADWMIAENKEDNLLGLYEEELDQAA